MRLLQYSLTCARRLTLFPTPALLTNLGLSNHILHWITDYLTNRQQRVVVNGKTSQFSHVLYRMPQGSVLGPLLFLMYVDDSAQLPLSPGKPVLY